MNRHYEERYDRSNLMNRNYNLTDCHVAKKLLAMTVKNKYDSKHSFLHHHRYNNHQFYS